MSDQIQGPGLIPDAIINIIAGVMKTTDIPKCTYCIIRDCLLIDMFKTAIYQVTLPMDTGICDSFNIMVTEDKKLIPMPIINSIDIIDNIRLIYQAFITAPIYVQYTNIKNDPEFSELLSLKADDGMRFYKVRGTKNGNLHTWFVPIFTGFPALNKNDNIDIAILESIIPNSAVVKYTIHKSKIKRDINMYFRILELEV